MKRKIWAILAFNFYAIFLISGFQENTGYLFDFSLISEIKLSGFDVNPREWGWGTHYIWRLFAGIVVTALVGALTGAIVKDNGAKIAAIANMPSVLVWSGMIYLLGFTDLNVGANAGFIVISIIAIPLTTYIAYLAGGFGEEIQRQRFSENTVLGIKSFHWIWAIFPLYWYSLGIVLVGSRFIGFQIATWGDSRIFAAFLAFLILIPLVAWVYPLRIVHLVLMGDLFNDQHSAVKGIAILGILISGILVATGVQFGLYWLLDKILTRT
jgi:hypothetical protein